MFKVGDKVKVISKACPCADCEKYMGNVGIIKEVCDGHLKVEMDIGGVYTVTNKHFKKYTVRSKRKSFKQWCNNV